MAELNTSKLLEKSINAIASGPALRQWRAFASKRMDIDNVITVDMGGTSFDVSLVTKGAPSLTRDLKIHENPVGVAAVDVHSIGAGGSIAWIDPGGA